MVCACISSRRKRLSFHHEPADRVTHLFHDRNHRRITTQLKFTSEHRKHLRGRQDCRQSVDDGGHPAVDARYPVLAALL
ncbi:MAG: hypothetical protein A4E57_02276 [Syntrophorhabdaceae bacterium PtaU1.Bin034]|jgi:hypothetical protein|nr:MAG: hypothetical protein A4E57_02276 [Syntrophorhabdaceae bacterium PtaU1.Bin034]